jgi:hypothetical protein
MTVSKLASSGDMGDEEMQLILPWWSTQTHCKPEDTSPTTCLRLEATDKRNEFQAKQMNSMC